MIPGLLAAMLYVAAIEGAAPQIIQLVGSTVLLAMIAAQFDARLTGEAEPDPEDLSATGDLLAVLDELLDEGDGDPPVAVCFFGAETRSAAGASDFFGRRSPVTGHPAVINFVNGRRGGGALDRTPVLLTAREGDLATLKMSFDLGADSPLKPERAILRRTTAALTARRRGLVSTTIVARGDKASDLGLDLIEKHFAESEDDS
jgi:hypothetical protein